MRDRREKRISDAFSDPCCVVLPRADDDQTNRAWHTPKKWRGTEHRLKLSGPRARDQTEPIER
jgi:hypothetical protein